MRYLLLTLFHPAEIQSFYLLDRESDSIWRYYCMSRTGGRHRAGDGHKASTINGAIALLVGIPPDQAPPAAPQAQVSKRGTRRVSARARLAVLPVVLVAIEVPILLVAAVPAMVVPDLAAIAFPVSFIESLSIVARRHPMRTGIGRTGPVSLVPLIVVTHRIPVAPNPGIPGAGASGLHSLYACRWRGADSHSDRKLSESTSRSQQRRQYNQFGFHDSFLFFLSNTVLWARRGPRCAPVIT
jgi:hypothetical protein